EKERNRRDVKRLRMQLQPLECGIDVLGSPDFKCGKFDTEYACRSLHLAFLPLGKRIGDIGQNRQAPQTGHDLLQDLESLPGSVRRLDGYSRDVAAGPGQAGDDAGAYRIARRREHDRDRRGGLLCCEGGRRVVRDDNINLEPGEFVRELSKALAASLALAIF